MGDPWKIVPNFLEKIFSAHFPQILNYDVILASKMNQIKLMWLFVEQLNLQLRNVPVVRQFVEQLGLQLCNVPVVRHCRTNGLSNKSDVEHMRTSLLTQCIHINISIF